jgi:hypothetical protein
MMTETLQQRYARTTSWTARHILQDEIAWSGGAVPVDDYVERKLRAAEAQDRELSHDTDYD